MDEILTAFFSEIEKVGSTRQVRELRNLFHAGNFSGLENLAGRLSHSGVLKETPAGTTLLKGVGEVGGGAEGVVTPVIGGSGAEARKHFFREGEGPLASRDFWKQKAEAGRDLQGVPGIVPFIGEHEAGNEVMHRYKYVPDMIGPDQNPALAKLKQLHDLSPSQRAEGLASNPGIMSAALKEREGRKEILQPALEEARKRGWVLQDVEKNIGNSKPTAQGATILDYLPVRPTDVAVDQVRKERFIKNNPNMGLTTHAEQNYHAGMGPFFPQGYNIRSILNGVDPRPNAATMATRLGPGSRQLPKPLAASQPTVPKMLSLKQGLPGS